MAAISLISIIQKNFQLLMPPSLGLWFSESRWKWNISVSYYEKKLCQQKWNISRYWRCKFSFSEFSIGSFSPITHPRLHFNIYAWLHLKHLCVDIYAWLMSHLCVVLHFLIFEIIQLWTFWTFLDILLKPPQPLMGLFFLFQCCAHSLFCEFVSLYITKNV